MNSYAQRAVKSTNSAVLNDVKHSLFPSFIDTRTLFIMEWETSDFLPSGDGPAQLDPRYDSHYDVSGACQFSLLSNTETQSSEVRVNIYGLFGE